MSTPTKTDDRATINPSQLFAISKGTTCHGDQECHWCASPCGRLWLHDNDPVVAGQKSRRYARRPSNPYVCVGCWTWSYRSVTIEWLSGGQKDGQTARKHSWWITNEGAWALGENCKEKLKALVLCPPEKFCLSFLENGENHLPLMLVNSHKDLLAGQELFFTVDGVKESYSVYELEHVIATGEVAGKGHGVRYLVDKLGYEIGIEAKKGPGRPSNASIRSPERAVRGKGKGIEITAWDESAEGERLEDIFPTKGKMKTS